MARVGQVVGQAAPRKVAVVGGGCGGVAAAFWLSAPELNGACEVTLYTQGWRLGGKGASGRRMGPDRAIKEHGLHLWFGCYHRAFQMMRLCYAEQGEGASIRSLADAFIPMLEFALQSGEGPQGERSWSPWIFTFPRLGAFPRDTRPTLVERISGAAEWCARFLRAPPRAPTSSPRRKADLAANWRQLSTMTSLAAAFIRGYLRDVKFHRAGHDAAIAALCEMDFREWLARSGASPRACNSPPVRALYDLAFAYPAGDTTGPGALAAGSAIGLVLELMGYRGAPFFKMTSGMGDTIFAPLYRVLESRGVRIELFHRLRSLAPDAGETRVEYLTFDRQAESAVGRYRPFVRVGDADCWPDQPLWDQLLGGAALREAGVNFESDAEETRVGVVDLRWGQDFDAVVLAVPPDVLKHTTRQIRHPAWLRMLESSASVATQSFQLWLNTAIQPLGRAGANLASSYEPPFSTWADMSHLLAQERWPEADKPQSLHYFCGPLTDREAAAEEAQHRAGAAMTEWLDNHVAALWPEHAEGWRQTMTDSWVQANVDASERYVQFPPGALDARLRPDSGIYENLFLAGDWTRTRYCGGCVENAVQSGLSAARAITGCPTLGGQGAL